jgi:small-conductance mechanosensitive channel
MATPELIPEPKLPPLTRIFGRTRLILIAALSALLIACLAFIWITRGTMANLPSYGSQSSAANPNGRIVVDLGPWQTAQALAAMAVTSEEGQYARDAERLADHEVNQAFASALRQAKLQSEHRALTGAALALSQKVAQLTQVIAQDQALVNNLKAAANPPAHPSKNAAPPATSNSDDLDVANAQLELDSEDLANTQRELEFATGDKTNEIQEELTAHQNATHAAETASNGGGQVAVVSEKQHGSLASRLTAWFNQRDRYQSLQQAEREASQDATTYTSQQAAVQAEIKSDSGNAANGSLDRAARLAAIRDGSAERQILGIYADRIQTQQRLATVYGKWSAQVLLQHSIVLHLIARSFSWILLILICALLLSALVRRLTNHPSLDRRQTHTLRSIFELGIQGIGVMLILFVIFGTPQETPTILGLATAALTIALQDYILAFLGWFVLMGKNGVHVGDWVEINGVGGEVTEIGLLTTTLLETGTLGDRGHPTGRRITFMNGFAIRGQYLNFSTTGQWMWDEIAVNLPTSQDVPALVERIHQIVMEETAENAKLAEQEWKRGASAGGLGRFSVEPVVNVRPSASGIETQVRFVTRASERFELRNRLYQRLVELFQTSQKPQLAAETHGA